MIVPLTRTSKEELLKEHFISVVKNMVELLEAVGFTLLSSILKG